MVITHHRKNLLSFYFKKVDIPVITTVEQLTESSIRIKWKFFSGQGNEKKFHFSRYRIQYSTDYFEKTIGEWPGN